jgi:hypothetical protein
MATSGIWFTLAQKAELWERWKQGQSISSISRALATVVAALAEKIGTLPQELRRSLTWGPGQGDGSS